MVALTIWCLGTVTVEHMQGVVDRLWLLKHPPSTFNNAKYECEVRVGSTPTKRRFAQFSYTQNLAKTVPGDRMCPHCATVPHTNQVWDTMQCNAEMHLDCCGIFSIHIGTFSMIDWIMKFHIKLSSGRVKWRPVFVVTRFQTKINVLDISRELNETILGLNYAKSVRAIISKTTNGY